MGPGLSADSGIVITSTPNTEKETGGRGKTSFSFLSMEVSQALFENMGGDKAWKGENTGLKGKLGFSFPTTTQLPAPGKSLFIWGPLFLQWQI